MSDNTLKPIGLFHTPASKEELMNWINAHRDPHVTTAAMMMHNFITEHYHVTPKTEER